MFSRLGVRSPRSIASVSVCRGKGAETILSVPLHHNVGETSAFTLSRKQKGRENGSQWAKSSEGAITGGLGRWSSHKHEEAVTTWSVCQSYRIGLPRKLGTHSYRQLRLHDIQLFQPWSPEVPPPLQPNYGLSLSPGRPLMA